MPATEERAKALYLGFLGSLAAGLLVWNITKGSRTFPTAALVCPDCLASVAQGLPQAEDEFILSAWQFAGSICYEPVGSHLDFVDSQVKCQHCLLPGEVLARGVANCVGHAAVLASILRNRLPPERVMMAIGDLVTNGVGGHAYVLVERAGAWYVLESTTSPGLNPWLPAVAATWYQPYILFNDAAIYCDSPQLCVVVGDCFDCRTL